MLIDSHAHIDGPEYDGDRDAVIARARDAGVTSILNVGTGDPNSGSFECAVALAENHQGIYAAVGVHPHDAKLYNDLAENRLINLARSTSKVIAWGEIGLDYHYENSPREVQREVFRRQIGIAQQLGLPVIIHSRSADDETASILRDSYGGIERPGIMHCFGGGEPLARVALDLGFLISFAGNITFKKADDLRAVMRLVPLDRLLVETDCPYLTPAPFRGKRNEPARVAEVARCIADERGCDVAEIARSTTKNFCELFRLASPLCG